MFFWLISGYNDLCWPNQLSMRTIVPTLCGDMPYTNIDLHCQNWKTLVYRTSELNRRCYNSTVARINRKFPWMKTESVEQQQPDQWGDIRWGPGADTGCWLKIRRYVCWCMVQPSPNTEYYTISTQAEMTGTWVRESRRSCLVASTWWGSEPRHWISTAWLLYHGEAGTRHHALWSQGLEAWVDTEVRQERGQLTV